MKNELPGVALPQVLENDSERARAYVAGYLLHKVTKISKVPEELQSLCTQYAPDRKSLERSGWHYPEVNRIESRFWSGYLASESSSRDKRRSESKETAPRDLTAELGTSRKSLENEIDDLSDEEE